LRFLTNMAKPQSKGAVGNKGSKWRGGSSGFNPGNASTNPDRAKKGAHAKGTQLRSKATIKRLNMYNNKPDKEKMREHPTAPVRIQPDRRWFGNTRVITQSRLQDFRDEIAKSVHDPFKVVLKNSKIPMSLLQSEGTAEKSIGQNLLTVEPYNETFGKASQRKRPKLSITNLDEMAEASSKRCKTYDESKDTSLKANDEREEAQDTMISEEVFRKGTSKRIWQELYKVVDSSDIIVEVIDARDPMGTRCIPLEKELKKNRTNKHLILLMNKCDLVPSWVAKKWVQTLSKEYPTLAFHASVTNPFGKNALMQLLRQFAGLMRDRKHVSVGFVGFPNVGKSSVVNALKGTDACKAAPVPGETKVWQYVALTKRIYLIDCPGIVPDHGNWEITISAEADKVLKGVVRPEKLTSPSLYIPDLLSRIVDTGRLVKKYSISPAVIAENPNIFTDAYLFLSTLAVRMGKLLKGGEPDIETVARVVIQDWQKGRLPYFVPPPNADKPEETEESTPEHEEEYPDGFGPETQDAEDEPATEVDVRG
jgi:nuclear GTP-binding protein